MLWFKEGPRPLVYGFFINYFYRLVTLALVLRLHASGTGPGRAIARSLTRPPHPQRPSYQVMVGEGSASTPGGFGAYVLVLAVMAYFSGMMLNVADKQLVTPIGVFGEELLAGLGLGLSWWLLDLADRRVTVRFDQEVRLNLGYNSSETTVLALTVLSGGIVSAVMGSPWPYFIALLAWKTIYDVFDEAKYPRGEHPT